MWGGGGRERTDEKREKHIALKQERERGREGERERVCV